MTLSYDLCSKLCQNLSLHYEKLTRSDLLSTWMGDHQEESVCYILENQKRPKGKKKQQITVAKKCLQRGHEV